MSDCPNCGTELEREDADHRSESYKSAKVRPGYILYCPECQNP